MRIQTHVIPGAKPDSSFWKGRRAFLTGHTGFKGGWLALWLVRMGAHVTGLSLAPQTRPNLFVSAAIGPAIKSFFGDVRDAVLVRKLIRQVQPEVIFHLAAQPLVRESYRDPVGTFAANVLGTVHVLEALRGLDSVKAAVMITTDKVYANNEWPYPYREADPLGGHDPYSASKAACELVAASYRLSFLAEQGVAVATVRAGNVIGGGDWSAERLIPDAIRAWEEGNTLQVRRPSAVRPWQHVLEPINAYLVLAERLWKNPSLVGAFNFGPASGETARVCDVINLARAIYGKGKVEFATAEAGPHEAGLLALETAKAKTVLGLVPCWPLDEAIKRTMTWYKCFYQGEPAFNLCLNDIAVYEGFDESL